MPVGFGSGEEKTLNRTDMEERSRGDPALSSSLMRCRQSSCSISLFFQWAPLVTGTDVDHRRRHFRPAPRRLRLQGGRAGPRRLSNLLRPPRRRQGPSPPYSPGPLLLQQHQFFASSEIDLYSSCDIETPKIVRIRPHGWRMLVHGVISEQVEFLPIILSLLFFSSSQSGQNTVSTLLSRVSLTVGSNWKRGSRSVASPTRA